MLRIVLMVVIALAGCLESGDVTELFETDESAGTTGTTYRYRTAEGRWAFTGNLDMVPPEQRASAEPMDLSNVSLNTDLGNAINESMAAQHERLAASDGCTAADEEAGQDTIARMWANHRPALGIAALALLLLFAMPMLARRIGAPLAGRVVMFALPIFGLLGALTFGLTEARLSLAGARETADLCSTESFARAPARERAERLERLEAVLAREGAVHVVDD
ncbi:MAG: hypothetical protein DRJ42_01885 [Deltaproteobacteria bacterium]|nr:MAG: hypothetical protein DRJ42_01885 [Deltaproteobacteria bacterium]